MQRLAEMEQITQKSAAGQVTRLPASDIQNLQCQFQPHGSQSRRGGTATAELIGDLTSAADTTDGRARLLRGTC